MHRAGLNGAQHTVGNDGHVTDVGRLVHKDADLVQLSVPYHIVTIRANRRPLSRIGRGGVESGGGGVTYLLYREAGHIMLAT